MRTESDSLGSLNIPKVAYYGIHTQRALHNFLFLHKQHILN